MVPRKGTPYEFIKRYSELGLTQKFEIFVMCTSDQLPKIYSKIDIFGNFLEFLFII